MRNLIAAFAFCIIVTELFTPTIASATKGKPVDEIDAMLAKFEKNLQASSKVISVASKAVETKKEEVITAVEETIAENEEMTEAIEVLETDMESLEEEKAELEAYSKEVAQQVFEMTQDSSFMASRGGAANFDIASYMDNAMSIKKIDMDINRMLKKDSNADIGDLLQLKQMLRINGFN